MNSGKHNYRMEANITERVCVFCKNKRVREREERERERERECVCACVLRV